MNDDFIAQIKALERAKIDTLLVDIAGNGGGSEWAEAAARMVTTNPPAFAAHGFRARAALGEETRRISKTICARLQKRPRPKTARCFLRYADEAAAKKAIAATPCDSAPLWEKKLPACSVAGRRLLR